METISFDLGLCHVVLAYQLETLSWGPQMAFAGRLWLLPCKVLGSLKDGKGVSRQRTSTAFYTLGYVVICLNKSMMTVFVDGLGGQFSRYWAW